jgi:hypothetical protein
MQINKYQSLIGQHKRNVTVLSVTFDKERKSHLAHVLCHGCNKESDLLARSIFEGKTRSCGCQKHLRPIGVESKQLENLVGQRFGLLTVKRFAERKSGQRCQWVCVCECGNEKIVPAIRLKNGQTKSCGCAWRKIGEESCRWKGFEEISGKFWSKIQHSAVSRKLSFTLSKQEVWDLFIKQNRLCALSSIPLVMGDNASIDRIDSFKGYSLDNVQWIDKQVNIMKWSLSQKAFRGLCQKIVDTTAKLS